MFIVKIKPLSVNDVRQGKRFKTPKYKAYENVMLHALPKITIPSEWKISLTINWYFSNTQSDIDNPCKPFQDILSKRYGFNDNRIYVLHQYKNIVPKWQEKIEFEIGIIKE